jgi:SAM-dependent methyltransferase
MLPETSARTLGHYESNALAFREGTIDHDVTQNVASLLGAIEGTPPFKILDFGCGPGRDLRTFRDLGHEPTGLDGCESFVEMSRAIGGVEVLHQDFLALSLPSNHFDGVFANASLFHIPSTALPRVLSELRDSLKPRGVLFCSNPRGNQEGWRGDRYACHFELDRWHELFRTAHFELAHHYYRPDGLPREQQPWLAIVFRRMPGHSKTCSP